MNYITVSSVISVVFGVVLAVQANAEFTVISQPDADYQESTTKIELPDVPAHTELNAITDGTLTVVFTSERPVYTAVVPDSWATWSSPPNSESATPAVLVNENLSLTMDLNTPVTAFGFELEPTLEGPFDFNVDFVFTKGPNGPITVGSVSLSVGGRGGARLFAATSGDAPSQDLPFDRIIVTGGDYFAIAQIRYELEPQDRDVAIDIKPGRGAGSRRNIISLSREAVIPVAILTDSDPDSFFLATTVNPGTVCFGRAEDPRQHGDCTEAQAAHAEDVDGDGDLDLVLYFDTVETGIQLGDTQACLTGMTFGLLGISGCDVVRPRR